MSSIKAGHGDRADARRLAWARPTFSAAMGKKDPKRANSGALRPRAQNKIDGKKAGEIFDQMEPSPATASKSHSAAHALISYQTAYLRPITPSIYLRLAASKWARPTRSSEPGRVPREGHRGPAARHQRKPGGFYPSGKNPLRLARSKAWSEGGGDHLSSREQEGPFRSLFEFCRRVDTTAVNRRSWKASSSAALSIDGWRICWRRSTTP